MDASFCQTSHMKLVNVALMLFVLFFSLNAHCATLNRVSHDSSNFSGQGKIDFPANTRVEIAEFNKFNFYLVSYSGEWKLGRADGSGTLKGYMLIDQANNPLYKQLHSNNEIERSTAEASIKRLRENAVFTNQDPDKAEELVLGSRRIELIYEGSFVDGEASGKGKLTAGYYSIKGEFYHWLPEGAATIMSDQTEVITRNYSKGEEADGPLRMQLYLPGEVNPTRLFIGSSKAGVIEGSWIELPWTNAYDNYTDYGIGERVVRRLTDGSESVCDYPKAEMPSLNVILGQVDMNTFPDSFFQLGGTDPSHSKRPIQCATVTTDGWKYKYSVVGGLFDSSMSPPFSCVEPKGHPGTMTVEKGDVKCSATWVTQEDRWLSKLGKDIWKQTNGALLLPGKAMGWACKQMCEALGRKEGENCHCDAKVGHTFAVSLPGDDSQQTAAATDRALALSVRSRLEHNEELKPLIDKWGLSEAIYGTCTANCPPLLAKYSRMRLEELELILTSGFNQDLTQNRVASITDDAISFMGKIRTVFPGANLALDSIAFSKASEQLNSEINYLSDYKKLHPEKQGEADILLSHYYRLADKMMVSQLFTIIHDMGDVVTPSMEIPIIQGLTTIGQIYSLTKFGIDANEFYSKYKEFKDIDQFYEKIFLEKRSTSHLDK